MSGDGVRTGSSQGPSTVGTWCAPCRDTGRAGSNEGAPMVARPRAPEGGARRPRRAFRHSLRVQPARDGGFHLDSTFHSRETHSIRSRSRNRSLATLPCARTASSKRKIAKTDAPRFHPVNGSAGTPRPTCRTDQRRAPRWRRLTGFGAAASARAFSSKSAE